MLGPDFVCVNFSAGSGAGLLRSATEIVQLVAFEASRCDGYDYLDDRTGSNVVDDLAGAASFDDPVCTHHYRIPFPATSLRYPNFAQQPNSAWAGTVSYVLHHAAGWRADRPSSRAAVGTARNHSDAGARPRLGSAARLHAEVRARKGLGPAHRNRPNPA